MSALTWSAAYPYYSDYDSRYYESQAAAERAEQEAEEAEIAANSAEQEANALDNNPGIGYEECKKQYDCPNGANCPPACNRYYN
jgi:hypothetical protein